MGCEPNNFLVMGSGAIGVEFASFYNTLGSNTTIVEVLDRVLPIVEGLISSLTSQAASMAFSSTAFDMWFSINFSVLYILRTTYTTENLELQLHFQKTIM